MNLEDASGPAHTPWRAFALVVVAKGSYSLFLAKCSMIAEAALDNLRLQAASWYARVHSLSNVADLASRLEVEKLSGVFPGARGVKHPCLPR